MSRGDPTGLYECTGHPSMDCNSIGEFDSALQNGAENLNISAGDRQKISTVSHGIGDPEDKNGVKIHPTELGDNVVGQAVSKTRIDVDISEVKSEKENSSLNPGVSESEVLNALGAAAIAYEETHREDGQPQTGEEELRTETRAYGVEQAVLNSLGVHTSTLGSSGFRVGDFGPLAVLNTL